MSNKKKYYQFNLPPVGPNLCDFYGQYIGFGGGNGGATGVTVRSIAQSALFNDTDGQSLNRTQVAGSATVWTFSSWIFKCGTRNQVFLAFGTGGAEDHNNAVEATAYDLAFQAGHFNLSDDGADETDADGSDTDINIRNDKSVKTTNPESSSDSNASAGQPV